MSDTALAPDAAPSPAPAPASDNGQPDPADYTPTPKPVESTPEPADLDEATAEAEAKAKAEKRSKSTKDALKKAAEKVAADEAKEPKDDAEADKTKAKADEPDADKKAQNERLARSREAEQGAEKDKLARGDEKAGSSVKDEYPDAPERFATNAKAEWRTVPPTVKAEVHRASGELERGFEKYKQDATAYNEIRDFDDLAKKTGTSMKQAMSNYVGIEMLLRKDPIAGFERIAKNIGVPLRDIAAHVLGQQPNQQQSQADRHIMQLEQKIERLEQGVGGMQRGQAEQQMNQTVQQVEAFAKAPGHEHFEVLAPDIENILNSGKSADLQEAYDMALQDFQKKAEQLNLALSSATSQRIRPADDPLAQNQRGEKSISGAPGPGSDTGTRKPPSKSTRDALKRAFARAG